jgi:hypothetical protein
VTPEKEETKKQKQKKKKEDLSESLRFETYLCCSLLHFSTSEALVHDLQYGKAKGLPR